MKYPKFEQKIRERVVDNASLQSNEPGYGIIIGYNSEENSATILMSRPGSNQIGEMFHSVPCPINIGVQSVAPEIGRPCWVVFKDGMQSNPMVTHFFSTSYDEIDYDKQYYIDNDTPRFMMEF